MVSIKNNIFALLEI